MELGDAEVVQEELLRHDHVADRDEGEPGAVGRVLVAGSTELGPVDPWQPPRTLAQTTKKWRASTALLGLIRLFHQPGLASTWLPARAVGRRLRRADEDCVVARRVQGPVGLVAEGEAIDHLAALNVNSPGVRKS